MAPLFPKTGPSSIRYKPVTMGILTGIAENEKDGPDLSRGLQDLEKMCYNSREDAERRDEGGAGTVVQGNGDLIGVGASGKPEKPEYAQGARRHDGGADAAGLRNGRGH